MTTEISSKIDKNINYEIFSFIWLDSQANNLPEYIDFQNKLRNIINYLKIFSNIDECYQYLQSTSDHDQIIFIVNDQFSSEIIPRIHSLKQISSIYIYSKTKQITEQWIKQYSKIKCMISELDEILIEIPSDECFIFSIFKRNMNSDQELNNQFIYFQLLIDCLLRIELNISDRNELISLSQEIYKDNKIQLDIIDEFEQNYSSNQSLLWYKRNTFLTKILNKNLCMENYDLIIFFRFFLRDIQQEMKHNQYSYLYRGQLITNNQLELFQNSIGDFISINNFLTMKFDRQLAISDLVLSDNLQRVLFEIETNSHFYSVINSSEILLMIGSIFRLINIYLNDDQIWIVQMKLCDINDENIKSLFDYQKENLGDIKLSIIGNILWKMNKLDQAEKYYLKLINILSDKHSDLADLYYNLGHIYSDKNDYDLSLKYYHKSLEIWMKTNDLNLANNYNAIATNYWKKGDNKQAFQFFNKALEIFKQIYDDDHINIAMCLNNMGTVISNEKNYTKTLDYYLKALTIFEKYFSINHPNLGSLHCNIGTIYKNLNQFDLALEHLNISLNIYEKSLAFNHPNMIMMLKNLSFLYEQKGDSQHVLICNDKLQDLLSKRSID